MSDETQTSTTETPATPVPPAAPGWKPKLYQIVRLTEIDKRTKASVSYPFLVDTITDSDQPKRDAEGHPVLETVAVKTSTKGTIQVTRQVLEKTNLYAGTILASWMQYPQPRRGVKLAQLSQPEV